MKFSLHLHVSLSATCMLLSEVIAKTLILGLVTEQQLAAPLVLQKLI